LWKMSEVDTRNELRTKVIQVKTKKEKEDMPIKSKEAIKKETPKSKKMTTDTMFRDSNMTTQIMAYLIKSQGREIQNEEKRNHASKNDRDCHKDKVRLLKLHELLGKTAS
ncbi:hypothetical protein L9F63_020049, partial [Diploptera punctata]